MFGEIKKVKFYSFDKNYLKITLKSLEKTGTKTYVDLRDC
jgi:hypothetical protein